MNTKSLTVIHGELDDRAELDGDVPCFMTAANPHKKYVVSRNAGHEASADGPRYLPAGDHQLIQRTMR